jgi:hypothetical protein
MMTKLVSKHAIDQQQTYLDLSHRHREIEVMADGYDGGSESDRDAYYDCVSQFKLVLRESVTVSFLVNLNAVQLLHVSLMCSSYRPFEPHSFLTMLGMAYKEAIDE